MNAISSDESTHVDVAISCLSDDIGVAQEIRDRLSPSLDVFLYTHRQGEVAGTDGLESFRSMFREKARLVVVLYRLGWGDTPWTRVEKDGITDRFLAEGPTFLFWITLDRASPPPRWLPERLIRFNLQDYGVEQAAGAIKARAQEAGSTFRRETPADRARRLDEIEKFEQQRTALLGSEQGVKEAQTSVATLYSAIQDQVERVQQSAPDLQIEAAHDQQTMVIRGKTCSVGVYWHNDYVNTLQEAGLVVTEFQGRVALPGQRVIYAREPKEIGEHVFRPDVTRSMGWCWRADNSNLLSSEQLAEECVTKLLTNTERVAKGKLQPLW